MLFIEEVSRILLTNKDLHRYPPLDDTAGIMIEAETALLYFTFLLVITNLVETSWCAESLRVRIRNHNYSVTTVNALSETFHTHKYNVML